MKLYGDSLTLQKFRDHDIGLRPSIQRVMGLIDTTDPAWPCIAAVLREMTEAGVSIDEAAFDIAAKLGVYRLKMLDATKERARRPDYHQMTLTGTSDSIVYYIRRGDVIKIGTTTVPVMRFTNLMPDEILAFEPGTVKQERIRHRQFAHLRCQGEHFRIAPELLEHARQLRKAHGDPDPDWPTVATLRKARKAGPVLSPPTSQEKVTAAEAAERFGLKKDRVFSWVNRRLISPAGLNERGHKLFYVEHIIAVRDRMASRVRQA